jgi:hypothetical protein
MSNYKSQIPNPDFTLKKSNHSYPRVHTPITGSQEQFRMYLLFALRFMNFDSWKNTWWNCSVHSLTTKIISS